MQYGRTALITAAINCRTDAVKYLVENANVQVNATDRVSHSNCVMCTVCALSLCHLIIARNASKFDLGFYCNSKSLSCIRPLINYSFGRKL